MAFMTMDVKLTIAILYVKSECYFSVDVALVKLLKGSVYKYIISPHNTLTSHKFATGNNREFI